MTSDKKKSFRALMVTQFFGAFNDNILKVLATLLVVQWVADEAARNSLVSLAMAIFVAPFILFSLVAGRVADRMPKPRVIVATKIWELLVVAIAIAGLLLKSLPLILIALFLISIQSTFFSPAKYGVLPEMMAEQELSISNAWLNIFTFAAILLGTIGGSFLAGNLLVASTLMAAAAVAGLIAAYFMQPLPAAKPETPLAWNPLKELAENWRIIRQDRALKLSVIAVNFFWFMGALLQTNIFLFTSEVLHVSEKVAGLLVVGVAVGVGLGSYLCGRLSKGKVELGLVPVGAFGMSVFGIDLLRADTVIHAAFDFFMMGMSAGFFDIPLMSLIQWRSPERERGRVMATVNFLSFVAIGVASGVLWLLSNPFGLDPAQVFFAMGLLSLAGTLVVVRFIPQALLRFVLYLLTSLFYRIRIEGEGNVPTKGPALLIANHLSLADGFLVGAAVPRLVRFLIWRPYYEASWFGWIARNMKAIPISQEDSPKGILRSLLAARKELEEGHLVCIFAEGQISRTGNLLEFKKGFEAILKGLEVPVIPVHLDRVWGSLFSFEHGKVLFKWPRRIPYRVTVSFGALLLHHAADPVNAADARQAVLDLGAEAFRHRLAERDPLPVEFLKRAHRQPGRLALADSSGRTLSFGMTAAVSRVLSRVLQSVLTPDPHVGLMIPPSVGGALANLAVMLSGRVPVNLNYTAGPMGVEKAMAKAGITRILASRRLLEKTGFPAMSSMIFIEDLMPLVSRWSVVCERALFGLLPSALAVRRFSAGVSNDLQSVATVMFSSGSTGEPKGVVLTHANILANLLGLGQVFDVGPRDRLIGVLPFFHSFGFTGTLWFPLIHGFSAVYHANPLDAKTIGELADRYHGSLMLSTPTFLLSYLRKCTPGQFRHMRFVITGAERLRESIARAFEEKFGIAPLEGYGCTELSPVACANVPNVSMGEIRQVGHKPGKIGHPIPGVSVKMVDPETFEPKAQGETGLLLVKGLNVMKGYLGEPEKTAAVIQDGWYLTGDIAKVDEDGFVEIVDRLARFSKIGGEMVPHVLVEEKLHQLLGVTDPTFVVTAIPDEKRGEKLMVLYVSPKPKVQGSKSEDVPTLDIGPETLDRLFAFLQASDLPKLWIPERDAFRPIEAIPYLGTGKLDLAAVKQLASGTL